MTLRDYILGSAWRTVLKIDRNRQGIFYQETYVDPNSNSLKTGIIPPEKLIFPHILYGISQTIWEAFIEHLDNQEVVALLNLKQHRHLWPAYQYALSAANPQVICSRAKMIGKFHFLLSMVLYSSEDLKQQMTIKEEFKFSVLTDIKADLDQGLFAKKKLAKIS